MHDSINIKQINAKRNEGIVILRPLLCFEIILLHFWLDQSVNRCLLLFYFFESTAVPVFVIISFYLITPRLTEVDAVYIRKRVMRLWWPLLVMALIYWFFFSVFFQYVSVEQYNIKMSLWQIDTSIQSLFFQLTTGHAHLNPSMWYQSVLLCLTLSAFIVFKYFTKRKIIYLLLMFVSCLVIQYSGLNSWIFNRFPYEIKYTVGRLFEMMPYAIIGILMSYYKIFDRIKITNIKTWAIITPIIILGLLILRNFSELKMEGYGYPGLLLILASTLLFSYFFQIGQYVRIYPILNLCSRYTLGIYCIHRLIAYLLIYAAKSYDIEPNMFFMCILIYVVSFVFCMMLDLSKNTYIRNLIN